MWFKNTDLRYFLNFSYNGTHYHGWQIQPNAITVQEILEDRISKILGQKTQVVAAGRTDAGVHASEMIAHVDADIPNSEQFIYRVNSFLPKDIAVHSLLKVKDDAHARFDAVERTYHYFLHYDKNPFKTETSWYWNYDALNVEAMNYSAQKLIDSKDFTSFARLHTDNKTNICDVRQAIWTKEKDGLKFTIKADRFLRNMVRAVVGTLVEVGRGKLNENDFVNIIEKKDRKFASASAPAHGLFLAEVKYPDEIYV